MGKMRGWGRITYEDGRKYEGEFQHNKVHGRGTYTYANSHKYEGEWKDGEYQT